MEVMLERTESEAAPGTGVAAAPALPPRIPSLDGIRAVAIGLVLISHVIFSFHVLGAWWSFAAWIGGLGVNIFFVLSGFLITYLLLKERDKTGRIDLKGFYIRRAFRILPPFYLLLLTIFVLQRVHVLQLPTRQIVCAGLFVFNYVLAGNTWITHSWSLSVEEQFYLFWPLVLLLSGPVRSRYFAFGLMALVPVVIIVAVIAVPPGRVHEVFIWILEKARFDSLMYGCALALLWTNARFRDLAQKFFRAGGLAIALLVLFVVCPMLNLLWPRNFMSIIGCPMSSFSAAACIYYFVENPATLMGRALNLKWVAHLGVISYSVYLWQQLFLNEKNTTISGSLPWSLLCTFAVAEFSFWCVERPALRLRDRLTKKNGPRDPRSKAQDFSKVALGHS